jgi:5-methylcytosine-specific restriction endonuclease McrA
MATSRTGTATWKRIRGQAIYRAKRGGLTNCPDCGVLLDYDVGQTPASAEVDHITPHSLGGTDTHDNVRVCCRLCNQSKGNRAAPKAKNVTPPLRTSRKW